MMDAVMPSVKPLRGPADRRAARLGAAVVALALALPIPRPAAADGTAPPLLGRTRPSAILGISPEWTRRYDEYRAAPADLDVIRRAPEDSLVTVYFGSWCSDSREGV